MAIDYASIAAAGGIPKVRPRVLERASKRSEHDRKLAKAYAQVDAREGNRCQVSGVELSPKSANPKRRREHHHLKGRNVRPEWVYEAKRIGLVSAFIHELLQSKAILVDGTDASKPPGFRSN